MCFPGRGTHITRDMCFLGGGTHITGIRVSQVGEHLSLGTFQSPNELYLLFHIPMRFLMVHFFLWLLTFKNKLLSFFTTGDWYDRSNICSHFQGIAWQVKFWQPFSIIYKYCHVLHLWDNTDLKIHWQRREREREKSSGFKKQNNNSARASRLFVLFVSVTARLRRQTAQFHL